MENLTGNILPESPESVLIPLHLSDEKLVIGLEILDSFPMGILGYMIAEGRAKSQGKLGEFNKKIDELIEKVSQSNG